MFTPIHTPYTPSPHRPTPTTKKKKSQNSKNHGHNAHNYTPFDKEALAGFLSSIQSKKDNGVINISYVGTVRFLNMDKKILRLFANDERFSINYFGRGSEALESYCKDNKIQNVRFHGSFSPSHVMDFYKETDLINNLYGNHTKELDYALSNKIYHAGQLHLPILVCPETYMQEVSHQLLEI